MTYAEGDPGHIDVHESIRLLFMAAGLDPSLIPAEAVLGGTTHISDHNKIADALAWLDENGVLGPDPAVISGTTGSPTVTTDGTATIYTFTGSGTLTVSAPGVVRARVCGGGGGGAGGSGSIGGPGGGGGHIDADVLLEARTYTITVGAGGAGGVSDANGGPGNASLFAMLLAMGGGYGGRQTQPGGPGASGGAGGWATGSTGGAAIYGQQGYAAPNTVLTSGYESSPGAGGAGGAGGANGLLTGGTGGIGASSDITGTLVEKCGGGAGSGATAGTASGGGGAGSIPGVNPGNGAANSGGGAGGAYGDVTRNGGTGGSGVVVIRVEA